MNIQRLKEAKKHFYQLYPQGIADDQMNVIEKKHKPQKMMAMAQEFFQRDAFLNPDTLMENWVKIVSQSSMVSLFEKPKFRDFSKSINGDEKMLLVKGLEEFLYGDREFGFDTMVDILGQYKMAKWTLITIAPFYFKPTEEVFIKPTTTKMAINYFELQGLKYSPKPSFDFYEAYRHQFITMRDRVKITQDNAAFGGFIMISAGEGK